MSSETTDGVCAQLAPVVLTRAVLGDVRAERRTLVAAERTLCADELAAVDGFQPENIAPKITSL